MRCAARMILDECQADVWFGFHHLNVAEDASLPAVDIPRRLMNLGIDFTFNSPLIDQEVSAGRASAVHDRDFPPGDPLSGILDSLVNGLLVIPVTRTRDKNPQSITGRPFRNRSTSDL